MDTQNAYEQLVSQLTPDRGEGEANSVARIVLEDAFSWRRGQRPRTLSISEVADLEEITKRLLAGEPVQYILKEADFFGLKFFVTPAVLIPRPETEELVEWALEWLKKQPKTERVIDIGTGSGCIPITLGKRLPRLTLSAVEVSPDALAVAVANADRHQVKVDWHDLDFLASADRDRLPGPYDLIVSNPPYIPQRERKLISATVQDYEPARALFVSDADPLIFYRVILEWGLDRLRRGGAVLFECNEFNLEEVVALATRKGYVVETRSDLQGKPRMLLATKP